MARTGIRLSQVVPWGRSLAEYEGRFALSQRDLTQNILGCADGPASFNAEMTTRGRQVVSCDPIYILSERELQLRFDATYATMMGQMPAKRGNFVWDTIPVNRGAGRNAADRHGDLHLRFRIPASAAVAISPPQFPNLPSPTGPSILPCAPIFSFCTPST